MATAHTAIEMGPAGNEDKSAPAKPATDKPADWASCMQTAIKIVACLFFLLITGVIIALVVLVPDVKTQVKTVLDNVVLSLRVSSGRLGLVWCLELTQRGVVSVASSGFHNSSVWRVATTICWCMRV
jgi:hypothetical protein